MKKFFTLALNGAKKDTATIKRCFSRLGATLLSVWQVTDYTDRIFFPGVAMIGIGVAMIRPAYAWIITGVILILAVRPIRSWFL